MSLTLVAIARNENGIDLTYEEIIGDPRPFVLTVTPTHVAHQVSKHLPISTADMQSYVLAYVANLEAGRRKARQRASPLRSCYRSPCGSLLFVTQPLPSQVVKRISAAKLRRSRRAA